MGFCFTLKDASAADGFRRIATEQIAKAIRAAGDTDGDAAQRIHDARKHCKKLRALLRLVRPGFPHFAEVSASIRDAAAGLSAARDRKVLFDTLNDLNAWADESERFLPGALAAEGSRVEHDDAALARFQAAMKSLRHKADGWTLRGDGFSLVGKGLSKTYRDARRLQRRAERDGAPETVHQWRKQVKHLWYQLRLFEGSAPDVIQPFSESAERLSDLLGLHHDLAVLSETLGGDPTTLAPGLDAAAIVALARRRQQELATRAHTLGRQLLAERPGALRRRFGAYWEGWRAAGKSPARRRAA
jgi:CHAD domain-containing protein